VEAVVEVVKAAREVLAQATAAARSRLFDRGSEDGGGEVGWRAVGYTKSSARWQAGGAVVVR